MPGIARNQLAIERVKPTDRGRKAIPEQTWKSLPGPFQIFCQRNLLLEEFGKPG